VRGDVGGGESTIHQNCHVMIPSGFPEKAMMVAVSRIVTRGACRARLTLAHLFRVFAHVLGFKVTHVFNRRTKRN